MHIIFVRESRAKLKGMTFDRDFGYSFSLFSFVLKKREEEKENKIAKIVIKSHPFQPGQKEEPVNISFLFLLDLICDNIQ